MDTTTKMENIVNRIQFLIAEAIGITGATHVLAKYLLEIKENVEAMDKLYNELWGLLDEKTTPTQTKNNITRQ